MNGDGLLQNAPWGLRWRSSTLFIIVTVGIGLFTDLFLYGIIVPVLPYLLVDRVHVPSDQIQSQVSGLLATYAGASVVFSPVAGIIADRLSSSRQLPFLIGLFALMLATILFLVGQNLVVLVLARILQGISAAVVWTIGLALTMDTVGPEHLGTTIGSIFGFISIGELAAPIIGGVVYSKAGLGGVFGIGFTVLAIDFLMRALLIEKRTAKKYCATDSVENDQARIEDQEPSSGPTEEDPLLNKPKSELYHIPKDQSRIVKAVPLLYCLSNPRLVVALLLALVHASLLATFDATIPIVGQEYYGFDSLKSGLIFIALILPYVVGGPVAGMLVDKKGPKPAAVIGFAYLAPALVLLRLTRPGHMQQIVIYCVLLALNGTGLAVIGSPSIVEASSVVQSYHEANPNFFGANGPYAQLYGLNSMVFSLGLTLGPLVSGSLKDSIGYGNMNLVVAAICLITSFLSYLFIGGKRGIMV